MAETEVGEAMQVAIVEHLLADAGMAAIGGQAVYAPGQPFADTFPRTTIWPPEIFDRDTGCSEGSEVIFTIHFWAKGDEAALVASRLAGAARKALNGDIAVEGHVLTTKERRFRGSRAVGDPDPTIAHIVSTFRFLTNPAA